MRATAARGQRGIGVITVLLASAVLLVILAVIVNLANSALRRSTEELHALQALAAADAGVGWARALCAKERGDVRLFLADLATAHSKREVDREGALAVTSTISVDLAVPARQYDHRDDALQENPQVQEAPVQVTSTGTVTVDGSVVAQRTTTALLRVFRRAAPYSEVVGAIDNAGPVGIDSPGDPAGQAAAADSTDLRVRAYVQGPGGSLHSVDLFQDMQWSDGNIQDGQPMP